MENIGTPIKSSASNAPLPTQEVPKESLGFPPPKVIRTMKSDMFEVSQSRPMINNSMTMPEKKAPMEKSISQIPIPVRTSAPVIKMNLKQSSSSHFFSRMMVVIVALLILGSGGWVTYKFVLPKLSTISFPSISFPSFWKKNAGTLATTATTTPTIVTPPPPLIASQSEKRFVVNSQSSLELFSMVSTERMLGGALDEIKNLSFVEEVSGTQGTTETNVIAFSRLVSLSGISAPDIFIRSVVDPFMAGLLGEEKGLYTPFMVFKVSAYDTGLAGMLQWEQNLPKFFDTVFGTKVGSQASAKLKFRDVVVAGHDARVLGGNPGLTLAYMLEDPTTIIVAESTTALEKLAGLMSGK